jgi:hypothetical protein
MTQFVAELNFPNMDTALAAADEFRESGFEVRILYDAIDIHSAAAFMNIGCPGEVDHTKRVEALMAPFGGFLAASGVVEFFDLDTIPDNGYPP